MSPTDFDEVSTRNVKILNRIQFQDMPIVTTGEAVSIEEMDFEILMFHSLKPLSMLKL